MTGPGWLEPGIHRGGQEGIARLAPLGRFHAAGQALSVEVIQLNKCQEQVAPLIGYQLVMELAECLLRMNPKHLLRIAAVQHRRCRIAVGSTVQRGVTQFSINGTHRSPVGMDWRAAAAEQPEDQRQHRLKGRPQTEE